MTNTTTSLLPIQESVQPRLLQVLNEVNDLNYERGEIAHAMIVALVSAQHLLMVGPGGTAKSQLVRSVVQRIAGAQLFETALDETSTPDQLLGPPDIKTMVEEGKTRRVPDGMLPTAHIGFIDEFFNGNGPVLHSIMPLLNERIFHNNGLPVPAPLISAFAGTNKLNADTDMAALWDRMHFRLPVDYVKSRDNLKSLLGDALERSVSTYVPPVPTTVTIDELRKAHDEAMTLRVGDVTMNTYLNLVEVLGRAGVIIGTRRVVEGLKAVVANAWLAGHAEVLVGDLAIVQHMFWTSQDDIAKVRSAVLTACNPGEQKALDLLDELAGIVEEYQRSENEDSRKRGTISVDLFKRVGHILRGAQPLKKAAEDGGASTIRIDELIKSTTALKVKIGTEMFNLSPEQAASIEGR